MGVRLVRRTGIIKVDQQGAAQALANAALEQIKRQLRASLSSTGAPLPAYSPLYQKQLQAIGRPSTPHVDEALIAGLRVISVEREGDRWRVVVGVGTGTSTRTPRPPPVVFQGTPEQQQRALDRWKRSSKRPTSTPPLEQRVELMVDGGPNRVPRDLIGVSPEGVRALREALERFPLFK